MSLLWPNQLQVALSAQGATVVSQSAGAGKDKLKQHFVPAVQNGEASGWQLACNSLDALLAGIKANANTRLSIVLSGDFIRYQLLPAQQVPMSSAEKLAYAAVAYKEIYGSEIDGWKIKLHETEFNQASIAAALDESFLDKLQQISQQHQIKLVSVRPCLMDAYNDFKKQLGKLNGYFVIVEASKLLLLNLQHGQCQHLHMSTVSHNWQQDLKQLLLRESMLNGTSGQEVLVYAPTHKQVAINKIEGWHVSRIGAIAQQTMTDGQFSVLKGLI